MKTLAHAIFLLLMSTILHGQDLTGQWRGTLHVQGTQLRIVFNIIGSKNSYDATLDSPDQNVKGIQVTKVDFAYPMVKFEISPIGAIYEGVFSDKGITGKWTQAGTSLFLALAKPRDSSDQNK